MAKSTFGFEDSSLEELVHWADIIDGAQFPSAQSAVELKEPAMRLMTGIEATRDRSLLHRIIRLMQQKPLAAVLNEPDVRSTFEAIYEAIFESIEMMRERATARMA